MELVALATLKQTSTLSSHNDPPLKNCVPFLV
jgi:hypothetical protein